MSLNLNENIDFSVEVSKGTRFVHYIVDSFCALIFVLILGFGLGVALGVILAFAFGPDFNFENVGLELFFNFVALILWVTYYVFFEYLFQRTPGKFLTGTMVVSDDGGRPSFGQILGRTFSRIIPFEPIIGLFSDFLHDTLPGTKVIMKG